MKFGMQDIQDVAGEEESSRGYITFNLGEQALGVEVKDVREVLVMQKITPMPDAPIGVLGVVDVRGTSLPVVDLKAQLGIPSSKINQEGQILIVEVATESQCKPLGVLVDRVRNVERIPADAIQPCPSIGISNWDSSIIEGLCLREGETICLLRVYALFGEMIGDPKMDEAAALI